MVAWCTVALRARVGLGRGGAGRGRACGVIRRLTCGLQSVLMISISNKNSSRVSQIPYPNTSNHALSHSKPSTCLRKCTHARIQRPRVWKKVKHELLQTGPTMHGVDIYIYIYIYRERERERCVYIYIYGYMFIIIISIIIIIMYIYIITLYIRTARWWDWYIYIYIGTYTYIYIYIYLCVPIYIYI